MLDHFKDEDRQERSCVERNLIRVKSLGPPILLGLGNQNSVYAGCVEQHAEGGY